MTTRCIMNENINNQMLTWLITISGQLEQINRSITAISDFQKDIPDDSNRFADVITSLSGDTLGDRIRSAMKMRHMSGVELAKRSGLDNSSISKYVRNITKPRRWHLQNIADSLMVDINLLLGDSDMGVSNGSDKSE